MPSEHNGWLRRELEDVLRGLEARSQRGSLSEMRGVNLCSNGLAPLERLEECLAIWRARRRAYAVAECA